MKVNTNIYTKITHTHTSILFPSLGVCLGGRGDQTGVSTFKGCSWHVDGQEEKKEEQTRRGGGEKGKGDTCPRNHSLLITMVGGGGLRASVL